MSIKAYKDVVNGLPFYSLSGVTRTGSTLLTRLLDSHPEILSTGEAPALATSVDNHEFVKVVVSKELYPTNVRSRQRKLRWVNPTEAKMHIKGSIVLTRSILTCAYSTYRMLTKSRNQPKPLKYKIALNAISGAVTGRMNLLSDLHIHEQYYTVHYSDLLKDPQGTMDGVFSYLGVHQHNAVLKKSKVTSSIRGDLKARESEYVEPKTVLPNWFADLAHEKYPLEALEKSFLIPSGFGIHLPISSNFKD
jgi:hypothetical protein